MKQLNVKVNTYGIFIFFILTFISLIFVIKFANAPRVQFQILTALAILYLSWAFFHHTLDKTLKLEIVIEYVLTALLAIIILYGTLF